MNTLTDKVIQNEYMIQKAISLISEKLANLHDEPKPTLLHSIRVGTFLHENNYQLATILGGYLHDVREDSDVTYDDLCTIFSKEVADLVEANTVDANTQKEERKSEVVDRCIAHSDQAAIIMATEILDGLKFYKRTQNTKQLLYRISKAQRFLEKNIHVDPIFDKLEVFIEVNA